MKIATLGSWEEGPDSLWLKNRPDFPMIGRPQDFFSASKEIGDSLARSSHTIVVGDSREKTADYNVVLGKLGAIKEGAKLEPLSVEVIRPSTATIKYEKFAREKKYQGLFKFYNQGPLSATECKLMAVKKADVVLTLGGGEGTYLAGLAALVAKKPLVPIPSFGGASSLLTQKAQEFGERQMLDHIEKLSAGPWTEFLLKSALEVAGVNKLPRILIVHGRSEDWLKLKSWLSTSDALVDTSNIRVMKEEFSGSETLPEKFEELAGNVDGAIALVTPDDVGGLADDLKPNLSSRARENVWLEVGWFWGRLSRERIMLLQKGNVQEPSDLRGIEFYNYADNPLEVSEKIREFLRRLSKAGVRLSN